MKKLKEMIEKRNALIDEADAIVNKAVMETRAVSEDEDARIKEIQEEVRGLDATIKLAKESRTHMEVDDEGGNGESVEDAEVRAFAAYIRSTVTMEQRAATNMTQSDNGAIIPATIADRIIKRVYEISPILAASTRYTNKGTLDLPYYDESTDSITVAYADEFTELASHSGKFLKISLTGFLAGALSKISRSLLNSTDVSLVDFVVNDMSEKAAIWIDKELLCGTEGKIAGLSTVAQKVTAAAASAVTADELIDVQDSVPDALQNGAMWIMNRKTRTIIRKLKDGNDRYLLQDDITAPFGKTLLGKPVYTSDNMPEMEAGKVAIYYGNMSGLATKFNEDPSVQILNELYAAQHAVGAVLWMELDAKIQVEQAIAALVMAG